MVCTPCNKSSCHSFPIQSSQIHVNLPRDFTRSACGSFQTSCSHPPPLWDKNLGSKSPTCDLCESGDNVQDDKHVFFHCRMINMVSFRRKYACLFPLAGSQHTFYFFAPEQKNSIIFFMNSLLFLWSGDHLLEGLIVVIPGSVPVKYKTLCLHVSVMGSVLIDLGNQF